MLRSRGAMNRMASPLLPAGRCGRCGARMIRCRRAHRSSRRANAFDIEPARGDVGRDQDIDLSGLQCATVRSRCDCCRSPLSAAAANRGPAVLRKLNGRLLGAHEHSMASKDSTSRMRVNASSCACRLRPNSAGGCRSPLVVLLLMVFLRSAQCRCAMRLDLRRHRRAEKRDLALLGRLAQDRINCVDKPICNISSASSSTTKRTPFKDKVPRSRWSITRPGVPTMTCVLSSGVQLRM